MKEHDLENRFSRRGKGKNEEKKVKEHDLEERFRKGNKNWKKKNWKKKNVMVRMRLELMTFALSARRSTD